VYLQRGKKKMLDAGVNQKNLRIEKGKGPPGGREGKFPGEEEKETR